jgi:hypothetical protein
MPDQEFKVGMPCRATYSHSASRIAGDRSREPIYRARGHSYHLNVPVEEMHTPLHNNTLFT